MTWKGLVLAAGMYYMDTFSNFKKMKGKKKGKRAGPNRCSTITLDIDDNFIAKNLQNLGSVPHVTGPAASFRVPQSRCEVSPAAVGRGEALRGRRHSLAEPGEGPELHTLPIQVASHSGKL